MLYGTESFDPLTATLRKSFEVPFPENGTADIVIHSLLVTNNNKLVIGQEVGGLGNKIKVVSLDNFDEVKEIDLGASRIPFDMALLSDGLVAVSCKYSQEISLIDVSGSDPVISGKILPPRKYIETAVSEGTGDELIVAGWTYQRKGYVDVLSRQGDAIRDIQENWDEVYPEHSVRYGSDLYLSVTDLNDERPLYRIELDTGRSISKIGTLDLYALSADKFFQGDVDSAGNLYFAVNGPTCFNGADEAPSARCVLVIAPDGRIRVLLYGRNLYRMATAVAVTPTGVVVAWQIEPWGPGSTYHVAVEGYEFESR
nr:hypothetical protein BaRGS_018868 [Batillaria attramentaria]